jgi:uncharacterized membrane protein YvbJ
MKNKIKEILSKKYFFFFNAKVGMDVWKTLPWRIKFSLVSLDIIVWSFIIICCILLIRKYFFGGTEIHWIV